MLSFDLAKQRSLATREGRRIRLRYAKGIRKAVLIFLVPLVALAIWAGPHISFFALFISWVIGFERVSTEISWLTLIEQLLENGPPDPDSDPDL